MLTYPLPMTVDAVMLGIDVKTGAYRVSAEILPRLFRRPEFDVSWTISNAAYSENAKKWLKERKLMTSCYNSPQELQTSFKILLSTFYAPQDIWQKDSQVLRSIIFYDLIPFRCKEYQHPEEVQRLTATINSMDKCTAIFAISEYTKKDLLTYRPDLAEDQITVIPLAAGERFKPCENPQLRAAVRKRYGIAVGCRYVLALATLEPRRNLPHLIRAFADLVETRSDLDDVCLVLSGLHGIQFDFLHTVVKSAGRVADRIILTGFVADEDLSPLYSGAACFACMSKYEGFGLPVLEAMQCGTPVIASNATSLPEVVGTAGILLDPDDQKGLVTALDRVLTNPVESAKLAAKGLERARNFSWDNCVEIITRTLSKAFVQFYGKKQGVFSNYGHGFFGGSFYWPMRETASNQAGVTRLQWRDRLPRSGVRRIAEGGKRICAKSKTSERDMLLVSYVTVVRNNTKLLLRTLESLDRQTYPHIEHIVLDGASTDGTLDVIRRFGNKIDYFVSEPDKGLYDAINKAIPLAKGEFICVLNSDDWLEPDATQIAVQYMRNQSGKTLLATGALAHSTEGETAVWFPAFVHPGSYFICANVCHNGIYASRQAYEVAGLYDNSYKIVGDFKWIMKCLEAGVKFLYTTDITVHYSMGGISADVAQHSLECIRLTRERFPFLNENDARHLYFSFFQFIDTSRSHVNFTGPENYMEFLRSIACKHADKPDFVVALAWASMEKLRHSSDVPLQTPKEAPVSCPQQSRFLESFKILLRGSPRLYAYAGRIYHRLRSRKGVW